MRILAQKFGVSIATDMFQQHFIDLFSLSKCTSFYPSWMLQLGPSYLGLVTLILVGREL
jgi:hypothetical protein